MSIRSGGPKEPPGLRPRTESASAPPAPGARPASGSKAKDRYEHASAGESDARREPPPARKEKEGRLPGPSAVLRQAVLRTTDELARLRLDADRILAVLSERAYAADAIRRHHKELERVRGRMAAARRRLLKNRRTLIEADSELDALPESELARVHRELDRLDEYATAWGRALKAVELAAEVSSGEAPRRLVVRGGDRAEAMRYAEGDNPTTAIADLAASALGLVEAAGREPSEPAPEAAGLGRSLDGQRLLSRLIAPQHGGDPAKDPG